MSSTKTTIFTARISVETHAKIRESGLPPREWVEKMAETPDFNGVYTDFGRNAPKTAENRMVDSVYTEFEELGFDELLSAMRRRGYTDRKIREINSQIREQILNA